MSKRDTSQHTFSARILERLYDRAFRQILRDGLAAVSLDDVAVWCQVDPEDMQTAFPSKKAFVHAILHWHYTKFSQQLRSVMDMHSNPYAALETALYEFVELCLDRERAGIGMFRSTLVDLCAIDEDLWQEFLQYHEVWVDLVRDKLVQSDVLLEDPAEIEGLVCFFRMAFVGLYEMVKLKRPKEDILQAVRLTLEPLKTRMK